MHAKAAIADDRVALVTIANLTDRAVSHNLEGGRADPLGRCASPARFALSRADCRRSACCSRRVRSLQHAPDVRGREFDNYLDRSELPGLPASASEFVEWYGRRREALALRLARILGIAADTPASLPE